MRAPLGAKGDLRPKEGANEQPHIRSEAADCGGTGGLQGLSEDGGKVALSEHERAQQAFHANRERLKAERLAREAADREAGRKPRG